MIARLYKKLKNQSFFLLGPRGTGKTTWLEFAYPHALRIDLLNTNTARLLLSNPHRLEGMILDFLGQSSSAHFPIIIDKVQKVPALLDEVHRLIEEKKFTFVLTASSPRKLRRGEANLLAGRAYLRNFYPFTCWELGSFFDLKKSSSSWSFA